MKPEQVSVPPRYRWEYRMNDRFGSMEHTWILLGQYGAVHLHVTDYADKMQKDFGYRMSGGVEMHYRTSPEYMENTPPSHDVCSILHAPCWHDGSSLMCSERFIPMIEHNASHEEIFFELARIADGHFGYRKEADSE